ncbi:MAG: site-specific integrase [Solirubrobacteraceae bacterium]
MPNPKLRFGDAADAWLDGPVASLAPGTQAVYRNAIETHLRDRWGRRQLDAITGDDVATVVADLRAAGRSESLVDHVLKATNQVYRHARQRMGWAGDSPVSMLSTAERAKTGSSRVRRRIYQGDELAQTLAAAQEPFRTLFAVAAVTGARLSECLGLVWDEVSVDDVNNAEIAITHQANRQGERVPLKTEESRRTIEIPRQLATRLVAHKLRATRNRPTDFVFATRSGRALAQRNVMRALRQAQARAVDAKGRPTFPLMHQVDGQGNALPVPKGAAPTFHGFRHSAASVAIAAGESAEEVSWQLGHRNSTVTREIYVQEIRSAERTARRRARMEAQYGSILNAAALDGSAGNQPARRLATSDS